MDEEYEYSFKTSDITPFIEYCKNNHYELQKECEQTRTLYTNGGKVMARITKNCYLEKEIEVLNFKDDNLNDNILNISRETAKLQINEENRKFVESLLEILELKEQTKLVRKRFVYKKNCVIFEIDKYTVPVMNVVAIEGKKEEVDLVYEELKPMIDDSRVE